MIYLFILLSSLISCNTETPVEFSEEALMDTFITLDGDSESFQSILDDHKGETLVIDVWASWCRDCIQGMPKVKALQEDYEDVTYIFLSLDKDQGAWKRGIEKYEVTGEHYFMQSGWKGPFGKFIKLDWIPRYIVVDKEGKIAYFKAIHADDPELIATL